MGKHRNTTKGGRDVQKGTSLTMPSDGGKPGDTFDMVQDMMEEVASLEEVLSQMGASSKMPFKFTQSSRSPSK